MKKINTPIMIVLASVFALLAAGAGYSTKNYRASGGDRWVIGGSLDVESGGDIDVESGGALKIAGTAVSASAAELNIMDGVTATAAEINVVDGVTSGTAVAGKAAVLGANRVINYLDITALALGGAAVTASSAELNTLDGVTASTAELNIMDGVTATASELNLLSGVSNLAFGTADAATSVTAVAVSGLLPGDVVLVTSNSENSVAVLSAVPTTDTLTVTLGDDPSSTATIGYLVLR